MDRSWWMHKALRIALFAVPLSYIMVLSVCLASLILAGLSLAHPFYVDRRLPSSTWYQARDHSVHGLFKRDQGADGEDYATVGSPAWSAAYPQTTPDSTKLPQEWTDALSAAESAGLIPNIPQSTGLPNENPSYPQGNDPNSPAICSATYKCRIAEDIWDAPEGYFGTGFDDGPTPATPGLIQFLESNNETATHFMIGINILNNADAFQQAFQSGGDIACHTYTHPYMTTLSNLDVVAQLGWTMEIIHNSTGGRVPKFWRPPYGDTDVRVSAIAREVFGLQTIIWNQDTEDWSLTSGGTTLQTIQNSFNQWLTGPKNPGLIVLEHELSDQSVQAFKDNYATIKSNGWTMKSVAQLVNGTTAYRNAESSSSSTVTVADIFNDQWDSSTSSSSSSSSSAATSSSQPASTSRSSASSASASQAAVSTQPNSSLESFSSVAAVGLSTMTVAFISVVSLLT